MMTMMMILTARCSKEHYFSIFEQRICEIRPTDMLGNL